MSEDIYQNWIRKSDDNLKWASDNFKIRNYALVCYLSEQAAEIALKGYLYYKKNVPPKTHQLVRLAQVCKSEGLNLDKFLPKLARLSEYYFESRYPDSLDKKLNNKSVAKKALKDAEKVVTEITKSLE